MSRIDIKNAVVGILEDSGLFKEVHREPTDIEKQRSFPCAWVNLNSEMITDASISTTNYMREIGLEISIGTKHGTTDTDMDEIVDQMFTIFNDEYTLRGTAINMYPSSVQSDMGYFHPYSIMTLNYTVMTR